MPESTSFTQWIADWAAVIGGGALVSALIVALRQLGAAREANQSQVMSQYYDRWRRQALREGRRLTAHTTDVEMRDRFLAAREEASREYYLMALVPEFFEDLALSVKHGEVGLALVEAWIGTITVSTWERWRLAVLALRAAEAEQPTVWVNFEALASDVKRIRTVRAEVPNDLGLLATEMGRLGRPLQ